MQRRARFLAVLAVAGIGLITLPAATSAWPPAQEPAAVQDPEDTPLTQQMEIIDRGMKALRRSVADAAKAADNAALVRGMKDAALAALPLCPEPLKPAADDKEKALWRIGFERRILALADGLLTLEQALVEGRMDDAKKQHEALGKLKKESHDVYVPDEE
jgi:soluble cytochrome b562